MAANIIDGDGGRISQIQNLVDCIPLQIRRTFSGRYVLHLAVFLSYDCFASSTRAVTSAVHDRMPAILDPDAYDLWLDPWMNDMAAASELLKPYDARLMRCYPVGTRINHVANDDEECSAPVELAQIQNRLFL